MYADACSNVGSKIDCDDWAFPSHEDKNQVKTVVCLIHVLSISFGLEMVFYICLRFPPHPLLQDMAPSNGT